MFRPFLGAAAIVVALVVAHPAPSPPVQAQGRDQTPQYRVDPLWPKPLPVVTDAKGVPRRWMTGAVAATCLDSREHLVTLNRAYEVTQRGVTANPAGPLSIAAPPIVEYDPEGNVVSSGGDARLTADGLPAALPRGLHGCFIDYENNLWIGGYLDGIVQKWTRDGKQMLLQIGTKGMCDGPPTLVPKDPYPTCGTPGSNGSQTLLNEPADIYVDPGPDPVTGQRGSVYIADGYGNHRVIVFDRNGKFLRQWGSAGSAPGQFGRFGARGGGHPHCVRPGNDGFLYVCDRGQNRIQVFDRMGNVKRIIDVAPPEFKQFFSTQGASNIAFSPDKNQTFIFTTDLDYNRIWIVHRESGKTVGSIGGPGRMAGQFIFPHTLDIDSKGNLYVGETGNGQRLQRFVRVGGS